MSEQNTQFSTLCFGDIFTATKIQKLFTKSQSNIVGMAVKLLIRFSQKWIQINFDFFSFCTWMSTSYSVSFLVLSWKMRLEKSLRLLRVLEDRVAAIFRALEFPNLSYSKENEIFIFKLKILLILTTTFQPNINF